MKKVFGQTVRDLKREVNKKVLKVSGIEQKVLDATSNEPWGPRGSDMAELAQASRNYHEYQLIMSVVWKRINDTGKNWRHVYKALTVLEYLLAHGSERVIDEIKEHAYQISTLADFQYIDSNGRDQGSNIRKKSQGLVALVSCKERIQEIRQKAQAVKDKYNGGYRTRNTSNSGVSSYVDRCDSGYNGNRDGERNGYGRDDDRYGRGRDSFSKDGGRHSRDFDERYARDYREGRGCDSFDYQTRSRSLSVDGYSERSFGDDDRISSCVGAPPSYEEAIKDAQNSTQDERDGECEAAPTQVSSSPVPNPNSPSRSTGEGPDNAVASDIMASPNNEFDAFDPRGSVSGAMPTLSSPELDIFGLSAPDSANSLAMVPATSTTTLDAPALSSQGLDIFGLSAPDSANSLAMVPVTSTTTTFEVNLPSDSGFGTNFDTFSLATNTNQPIENPFGDSPFKAIPQENFPSQLQNFQPATSFRPSGLSDGPDTLSSAAQKVDSFPVFDFGDAFGGVTYAPISVNGEHSSVNPPFLAPELSGEQSSNDILDSILPRTVSAPPFSSQEAQPALSTNMQTAEMNPFQCSGFSVPVFAQGSSRNAEAAQMNPFHMSELSAPVGLKEIPTNSDNLFLPSSGILASATSPRSPTNIQATQGNFLESSGPSVPAASQGSATNMQTSEMNILGPLGLSAPSAPQGPRANMQSSEMNFFRPPQPSASAVPQGSQANMQQANMNLFQPSGLSAPMAFTAPTNMQAIQSGDPNDMQSAHLNVGSQSVLSDPLASQEAQASAPTYIQENQPGAPTNMQPAQSGAPTNMQPTQSGALTNPQATQFGAPTDVQAAQSGALTNMQTANLNLNSQSMLSDPLTPQAAQPTGPPDNMQTAHFNLGSLSMLSDPLAPQRAQAAVPNYMQATHTGAPANVQTDHFNLGSQPMLSDPFASQETPALADPPAKLPSKEKFEPKSTVWADTLSRGLVNFNISGPKTNPLDDIGVDFAAINRKEKRLEAKSSAAPVVSTITMGKAMGSGSGLGRAGAGGLAPPNPMMGSGMGMGMGMGGGGGLGMGMGGGAGMGMNIGGYGGNMSQPPMGMNMGMNMGMGRGAHGQPPTGMPPQGPGMPGSGYNPMMGMGGYSMQQPYGGGYR